MKAGIIGIGRYIPEKVLTNFDLEKMVETSDEWIRTRTGIEERRIAAEDEKTSDMAVAAARRAMEDANIEPEDLDMILVATVTPDQAFPTVSCMIQEKARCIQCLCNGYQRSVRRFYVRLSHWKTVYRSRHI